MKNKVSSIILIPFIIMILGYLLLVIVNLIPSQWIHNEAEESANILMSQGPYPSTILTGVYWDNWTDSDCISITINKSSTNPFFNAIHGFQYASSEDSHAASIEALYSSVYGNASVVGEHSYLWNGFQIWLRVLMIRYNISEIRVLLYLITIFLSTFLCVLLTKAKSSILGFIPFLLSFSFFGFQLESLSLLFFNDFTISLVSATMVIYTATKDKENYNNTIFAATGASIAFFSMLILPILALAFPLIIALTCSNGKKFELKSLFTYTVSWLYGYGLTMGSKIIISMLFINSTAGITRLSNYTGMKSFSIIDRLGRIKANLISVIYRSKIERHILLTLLVFLVIYIVLNIQHTMNRLKKSWVLFIVALYPAIWSFVCAGHTVHGWTYWNYSISLFSLLEVLFDFLTSHTQQ